MKGMSFIAVFICSALLMVSASAMTVEEPIVETYAEVTSALVHTVVLDIATPIPIVQTSPEWDMRLADTTGSNLAIAQNKNFERCCISTQYF